MWKIVGPLLFIAVLVAAAVFYVTNDEPCQADFETCASAHDTLGP